MTKQAFCTDCGTVYKSLEWPRHCEPCDRFTWKNPIPVVNVLQPIYDPVTNGIGLAIAQRAIEPAKGGWAFVGGYVDMHDACLISAARREFREETGLEARGDGKIVHSQLNAYGNMIISVVMSEEISLTEFQTQGKPCAENYALDVLWSYNERELCFPIHTHVAEKWFNGEYRS
jgi:8-oxo-dGTP pyrophosphatase MutT (NUDIX family)